MPVSFKEYIQIKTILATDELDESSVFDSMLDKVSDAKKKAMELIKKKEDDKSSSKKPEIKRTKEYERRVAEFEARKAKRPQKPTGTIVGSNKAGTRSSEHDRTGDAYGFGPKVSEDATSTPGEAITEAKKIEFEIRYTRPDDKLGTSKIVASNAESAEKQFNRLHRNMKVIWVKPSSKQAESPAELQVEPEEVQPTTQKRRR